MRTALYDSHVSLGAKMVDFAGWEMPLSYKSVVAEHWAVRKSVGIFDVSHMGRILIKGTEAERFLDFLSTNYIAAQSDGMAIYTVLATQQGGSVDDAIVYRNSSTDFFIVVNAANRQKDLDHIMKAARSYRVEVVSRYTEDGIIAVQGPLAEEIVRRLFSGNWHMPPMRLLPMTFEGVDLTLSRTGYTGSGGFEIIAPNTILGSLWEGLLKEGAKEGIQPAGLGARDTLRLEAGYALYGHELSDDISPTESVSAWTVKWKKRDFLGQEAMLLLQNNPKKRSQHGVALLDQGIPRAGCTVFKGGKEIGVVTSGSHSPCLDRGIAIVMVSRDLAIGETVEIEVRGRRLKGEVMKLPFYKA